jgi:outer membrane lipoprotein carrier protein
MKKILISTILIGCLLSGSVIKAQDKAKGKQIMAAVSAKYKATGAFRAYFTFNMTNASQKINETYQGNIVIKGEKFHLILPEQEVMTDGTTQWTYIKKDNEVAVTDYEPDEDELTPNKIYELYEKDYEAGYIQDKTEGGVVYEIVELKPKNKNADFTKIRLTIVKEGKSIKSWQIFERNATQYVYTINKFATITVGDTYFKFDPKKYSPVPKVENLK